MFFGNGWNTQKKKEVSKIKLHIENETDFELDPEPLQNAARLICEAERPDTQCQIGVLVCGDETMQKYNRLYRGDDSVTDVLSFDSEAELPKNSTSRVQRVFCDIIIDINQLQRQKGSNSIEQELMDIFIHGLLHGLGYDHIRAGDQKLMKTKEKYYNKLMRGVQ